MKLGFVLALALTGSVAGACAAQTAESRDPNPSNLTAERFRGAKMLLEAGVAEGAFPGAVVLVGWRGRVVYTDAVGRYGVEDRRLVTENTIYDLASLTKVIGLTTAVMLLAAEERLDLDDRVAAYLPTFRGVAKNEVTVRHLLTHTSGLEAWRPLHLETMTREEALDTIMAAPLEALPGHAYVYSDLGAITLGRVVETASGMPLDVFLRERVFEPLAMGTTAYRPSKGLVDRIAPTEYDPWRGRLIRGEVHDENAARLGGVAGHAGLFSTAPDLGRFALWILNAYHGRLDEHAPMYVPATLVREFAERQPGPTGSTRALGWDTPAAKGSSAGTLMSPTSFGHTGFTGTSIWIDPAEELFVILLTNRVHPTRENTRIRSYRGWLADSVVAAIKRW